MKKLSIFGILMLLSFVSKAECPVADELIDTYGISFSGFKSSLPKAPVPQVMHSDNVVLIQLPNKKGYVHDGFFHFAVISTADKRAWLHRVGGFVSVDEWYGPIKLKTLNLKGCILEKYVEAKRY